MPELIVPFGAAHPRPSDPDTARLGGKGASLAELVAAGFPVPGGFVVATDAFTAFAAASGLDQKLREDGASGESLRAHVASADLDPGLADAIRSAANDIAGARGEATLFAVRSSATAEDLGHASFAGQHDTYYYVKPDDLPRMVRNCWASLYSDSAWQYRETQGIAHVDVAMAVVVQVMVRARTAGVTFSVDPVTGDREQVVTEACWGMGAALVDGRVTPDRFMFSRDGELRSSSIGDKQVRVASEDTDGSRLVAVDSDRRKQPSLSEAEAREVSNWALRAEDHYGTPQDIEWAIEDGVFHLLQSRAITTLDTDVDPEPVPAGRFVVFKPVVENFTEPMTPLACDVFAGELPPGVVLIRGRVYLDVDMLRKVLPLRLDDAGIASLLYLETPENPPRLDWKKLPLVLVAFWVAFLAVGTWNIRTARLPVDFMAAFRARVNAALASPVSGLLDFPPASLATDLLRPAGEMPLLVNIFSLRYVTWNHVLARLLARWVPDLPRESVAILCSGQRGVKSTEMGRGIFELARIARESGAARSILLEEPLPDCLDRLEATEEARPFVEALQAFLDAHGHRGLKELEISSPRFGEDCTPVLAMVRNYLDISADDIDPLAMEHQAAVHRDQIMARIRQALGGLFLEKETGWRQGLVNYAVERSKAFARLRENSRYYHTMLFNLARTRILRRQAKLMERGSLRCDGDIFYLQLSEIHGLEAGELGWRDVEQRIHDRRLLHVRRSKRDPERVFGIELPESEPVSWDSERLAGQGASPGVYRGPARVILDPGVDAGIRPGEILVAPYTDPAWTPLFLTARAAVVEVGSYLSHAGTIAREYGMPCVVDVKGCTQVIRTGDLLEVDGAAGEVRRLSHRRPEDAATPDAPTPPHAQGEAAG